MNPLLMREGTHRKNKVTRDIVSVTQRTWYVIASKFISIQILHRITYIGYTDSYSDVACILVVISKVICFLIIINNAIVPSKLLISIGYHTAPGEHKSMCEESRLMFHREHLQHNDDVVLTIRAL